MSQDKIGTDQWVEQYQDRLTRQTGLPGLVNRLSQRLPVWAWLVLLVALGFGLPLVTDNSFAIRIAGNVALLGTLALGLNVVVGYTGLLDLGFVAFYGVGAYTYAYLSSNFSGIHVPTGIAFLVIAVVSGLFGLLLGLPSIRLIGDYLAIVTLGFGLVFVTLMNSLTRVMLPGQPEAINLTGGPNGIINLDPIRIFGWTATTVTDYYYVTVVVFAIVVLLVYHLYKSRIGRAWSALREDELAAEVMGIPTRRLKIQVFAAGAVIAGISGGVFAAWQGSVFPANFDTALLITIYAIVVLGGLGSLPGVLLGALVIIAVPDILRNADLAGKLFYIGVVLMLISTIKPRWQAPVLLVAVAAFGFAMRALLMAVAPDFAAPLEATGSALTDTIRAWLVIPDNFVHAGNLAFAGLIVMVLGVTRIKHSLWRLVALVPTLYLLVFVWETRLSREPSITRLIFVGLILIVLMIYRPNGLLGQRRVEIA